MESRKIWIIVVDENGTTIDSAEVKLPADAADADRLTVCHGEPCLHNEIAAMNIGATAR